MLHNTNIVFYSSSYINRKKLELCANIFRPLHSDRWCSDSVAERSPHGFDQ